MLLPRQHPIVLIKLDLALKGKRFIFHLMQAGALPSAQLSMQYLQQQPRQCPLNGALQFCVVSCEVSVGFIGGQQSSIHRLHAGWTGEGAHQPWVNAIHMINV